MSQIHPFTPAYGYGVTASASTSNGITLIPRSKGLKQLVLTNLGSDTVYVRPVVGNSGTATTADYPILPNSQVVITKDSAADHVAHLAALSTSSVHIIAGEGF